MKKNGIIAYREKLEQIIDSYHDFLSDAAERLCREHRIPSAKDLQVDLASIVDEDRLLKIGIVGRVKSGKSSLLNALLFSGQSILPKAATPMTAALTTLSHGETLSVEVEFFSEEDFEDIKAKHDEYNRQLDRLYREILEQEKRRQIRSQRTSKKSPKEQAQSKAEREMREKFELLSAHEQYTKMQDTGLSIRELGKNILLEFEELSDLSSKLDDYVGANGRYMPFTKSVNIRLPQENLMDIEIVDTPGINDPVQSREERTREHLNQCDVVLILSPSGQFMNETDLELMDRITSKEGIRELYVVAAQADTQLFGNLKDENNGQLDSVLDSLSEKLGTLLKKIIVKLKEHSPEVGDTYDQLLQGQNQIILSSGICESLKQLFDQKDEWDELMQHVWKNLLVKYYPDYFSDTDEDLSSINLDKLSNISAIQNIVERVHAQKQEIINKKRMTYIQTKRRSLHDLKDGLLTYAHEQQSLIESTDIEQVKEQRKKLKKALNDALWDIKLDYKESVKEATRSLRQKFQQRLKKMGQDIEIEIDQAEETKTGTRPQKGFWAKLFFKKEEYQDTTVRTNAAYYVLLRSSMELTDSFIDIAEDEKTEWRNGLIRYMTKNLRNYFKDESLDALMIRRVIRIACNAISIPDFECENQMPDSLKPQGVLEGNKAKRFVSDAEKYFYNLYYEWDEKIRVYINDLNSHMNHVQLEERLLEQTQKELNILEQSIANKERELKKISRLRGDLERVEVNE